MMGVTVMAKNIIKRSDTYRRDFIKSNPGFMGKFYFCYVCKKPMTRKTMQVDHIMPISKLGGTNMRYNLAPICPKCNKKKSNKVDHRVLMGYGHNLFSAVISVPFAIIGGIFSIFFKMNWKLKAVVIILLLIWLKTSDFI